jgi:ABC-type multidrug transport system fused ATPase/permease subunit
MLVFLKQYEEWFLILGVISALLFVITLLLTPYLLGKIPQNYFLSNYVKKSDIWWLAWFKNILGFILFLAGIIMLFTPGQGIISILIGLFLMSFPKKRQLEYRLIQHNNTFKTLNWLRKKSGKSGFER